MDQNHTSSKKKAVVLLSGGLDSATCLAWANQFYDCEALSFNYGQRHISELQAAKVIAQQLNIPHRIINIDLKSLGGSALTDESIHLPSTESVGIPITYVPARNTIFLSYALAVAEVTQSQSIVIGVNAVDYSGYPDCRPEYITAFAQLANLATKTAVEGQNLVIDTPLLHLSKAEIIQLGHQLGVNYALTVSCYQANDQGHACGTCDSCRLRQRGFIDAGVTDPTVYRLT